MTQRVIAIVESEANKSGVTELTELDSLGLDSLEFVQLMVRIRSEIADIPDEKWAGLSTVGDIARALEAA